MCHIARLIGTLTVGDVYHPVAFHAVKTQVTHRLPAEIGKYPVAVTFRSDGRHRRYRQLVERRTLAGGIGYHIQVCAIAIALHDKSMATVICFLFLIAGYFLVVG